jgi:hypothetical protein
MSDPEALRDVVIRAVRHRRRIPATRLVVVARGISLGIRATGLGAAPMSGFDAAGVDAWFDRLPRLEHEVVSSL